MDEIEVQLDQFGQQLKNVEDTVNEQPLTISEMQYMKTQLKQQVEEKENAAKESQLIEDQIWKAKAE